MKTENRIIYGDNLPVLKSLPAESVSLVYTDPPFNTGIDRVRQTLAVHAVETGGTRIGFKDKRHVASLIEQQSYGDAFADFSAFLMPRVEQMYRVLKSDGSLFLQMDYREVHYCKLWLDQIFGRDSFINEIIWAYGYGARSKRRGRVRPASSARASLRDPIEDHA